MVAVATCGCYNTTQSTLQTSVSNDRTKFAINIKFYLYESHEDEKSHTIIMALYYLIYDLHMNINYSYDGDDNISGNSHTKLNHYIFTPYSQVLTTRHFKTIRLTFFLI